MGREGESDITFEEPYLVTAFSSHRGTHQVHRVHESAGFKFSPLELSSVQLPGKRAGHCQVSLDPEDQQIKSSIEFLSITDDTFGV